MSLSFKISLKERLLCADELVKFSHIILFVFYERLYSLTYKLKSVFCSFILLNLSISQRFESLQNPFQLKIIDSFVELQCILNHIFRRVYQSCFCGINIS